MTPNASEAVMSGVVQRTSDVACTLRDGTVLLCDVYRPTRSEDLPVILMRTPYGKSAAQAHDVGPYAHPSWFAQQGYIVVVQDVRGRHSSGGEFVPLQNELLDGYDTLEWCAHLDGARGGIGMYGMSYPGFVQLAAAGSHHPGLKCIAPGFTSADPYQWAMKAGLPRLAFIVGWALGLAIDEAIRRGNAHDAQTLWEWTLDPTRLYGQMPLLGSVPLELIQRYMPFVQAWLTEDDPSSEYWESQHFEPSSIPALYMAGWYDIWLTETIGHYERQAAAHGNARLLVGPWSHAPWRGSLGPGCKGCGDELSPTINHLLLEWFDWNLKGMAPSSWLDTHPACWFDYGNQRWAHGPFTSTAEARLRIQSDGLATVSNSGRLAPESESDGRADAATGQMDVIVDDPLIPTPSVGGWSCCYPSMAPVGAEDQRAVEAMSQVAVYSADPLPPGTRVCGRPRVTVDVSVQFLPATLVTTLCLVRDDHSYNISRGVWRKHNETSGLSWVALTAEIEMSPIALTLRRDDQIRLLIHTSSFPEVHIDPHTDVQPARASRLDTVRDTIVIRHGAGGASSLVLPLTEEIAEDGSA